MGVKIREKHPGSGEFWVFINHQGKRVSRKVGTRAAAQKVAEQIEARLTLEESPFPEPRSKPSPKLPTLGEQYEKFSKAYMQPARIKETTRSSYEMSFRVHILPELGSCRLDEITYSRMELFVAHLVDKGLAKYSIQLILAALSILFTHAKKNGLVSHNPVRGLGDLYKHAPTRHEAIEPLTHEEVPVFLQGALRYDPKHYPLYLAALHTGLRSGEQVGLKWIDVDSNSKYVLVRRSVVDGRETSTKTGKTRKVDLSDALLSELRALKTRTQETYLKEGRNEIPEWIFCNGAERPINMRNLKRRHFQPLLKKVGLRRLRWHDLRHSYATLLISNGESLAYVRDQLGHSSIKMTVDTYTHWIPGSNRQAVNKLPTEKDVSAEALQKATK